MEHIVCKWDVLRKGTWEVSSIIGTFYLSIQGLSRFEHGTCRLHHWDISPILVMDIQFWLVVWLPFFIFPLILGCIHHPNWLSSYFSEGWPWPTNQIQPVEVRTLNPPVGTIDVVPVMERISATGTADWRGCQSDFVRCESYGALMVYHPTSSIRWTVLIGYCYGFYHVIDWNDFNP